MGRKGDNGGTAGGTRSGKKNNVTYTRVIPKFLQNIEQQQQRAIKRSKEASDDVERTKHLNETELTGHLKLLQQEGFQVYCEKEGEEEEQPQKQRQSSPVKDSNGVCGLAKKNMDKKKLNHINPTISKGQAASKSKKLHQKFSKKNVNRLTFSVSNDDDDDDDDDDSDDNNNN